jgi:hypothetical protein
VLLPLLVPLPFVFELLMKMDAEVASGKHELIVPWVESAMLIISELF